MKISIVTAYYNRKKLFDNTLLSISKQIENHRLDIEVIAVDDGSDEDERLENFVNKYPFLKIIRLEKNKWYSNSCIPFNIGFKEAKGDIIILQNPECTHYGDVLKYTLENITDENYISFACFSLGVDSTDNMEAFLNNPEKLKDLMQKNSVGYIGDGSRLLVQSFCYKPDRISFLRCNYKRKSI
ncbi:glycosyltransferase family 2 protein [Chryseobacterium indoltheticum]|uniref:glycosyltransferase family 2 protein n=1 Tax=Chryseobacterium indoltheticum TaxID=254 RepID=UPI003F494365